MATVGQPLGSETGEEGPVAGCNSSLIGEEKTGKGDQSPLSPEQGRGNPGGRHDYLAADQSRAERENTQRDVERESRSEQGLGVIT